MKQLLQQLFPEGFRKKLSREKMEKIAITFLLGVFFLILATPASKLTQKEETEEEVPAEQETETAEGKKEEYIGTLENKLEETIGGMDGAGKVVVMVTLKNDGEKILDKNEKQESQTETVLLEEDGNTAPIVVQERYPDVEGVVVVCEGGDDAALSLHIKEAVTALFGIDAHKVVVCKLQQAYQN